jgi:hypothetical protein
MSQFQVAQKMLQKAEVDKNWVEVDWKVELPKESITCSTNQPQHGSEFYAEKIS